MLEKVRGSYVSVIRAMLVDLPPNKVIILILGFQDTNNSYLWPCKDYFILSNLIPYISTAQL